MRKPSLTLRKFPFVALEVIIASGFAAKAGQAEGLLEACVYAGVALLATIFALSILFDWVWVSGRWPRPPRPPYGGVA